jgi:hypothetical protein
MKARKHFLGVISDGRDNTHPRYDNPLHDRLALPFPFVREDILREDIFIP